MNYADLKAFRDKYNTDLIVDDAGLSYRVRTILPSGMEISCIVNKWSDAEQTQVTAECTALLASGSHHNKPLTGSIIDPNSPDYKSATAPWSFRPIAGKVNDVDSFLVQVDADAAIPAENPMMVNLVLSPDGYVLPAWNGTPYLTPDAPLGYMQTDGTWLDLTPPEESGQNYLKWWHFATGAYVATFRFSSIYQVTAKGPKPQPMTIGGNQIAIVEIPYKERRAALRLRSSKNERIEVWPKNAQSYNKAGGGPAAVVMVTVFSSEFPELA